MNVKYPLMRKRLQELRKEKGLTQKQVATSLCWSVSTLKQYESGNRQPWEDRSDNLQRLADFYNVLPGYIVGDVSYRTEHDKLLQYWDEHIDVKKLSKDVADYENLFEAVNTVTKELGFDDSDEELFPEFLKYIDSFLERKVNQMKRENIKVVIGAEKNQIIEDFETGVFTIYAVTEADVERGFQQLIKRGIISE